MSDILDLTITEASRLLRSGEISCRDLTKACLEQIQEFDPQIHAFLTMTAKKPLPRQPGRLPSGGVPPRSHRGSPPLGGYSR